MLIKPILIKEIVFFLSAVWIANTKIKEFNNINNRISEIKWVIFH
jgi:hypothetical protein